jgi:DNA-binding GntR family transcriptional regulator
MITKSSDTREVAVITETAGEKVYRRLRNDIISGRLAPSQKLRLDALKESYGASMNPAGIVEPSYVRRAHRL